MKNAYQEDLAYIHDVGFTKFLSDSTPALLKIMRQHRIKKGHVVDIGCGSGTWAKELEIKGYSVSGIDISSSMIDIARRRAPKSNFVVGSFLKYQLPSCEVVTAFGEIFNYLFDKQNNLTRLYAFFKRVYDALQPDGLFIFDIAEPGRGQGPKQKHVDNGDWTVIVDVEEDAKTNRLTRQVVNYRKIGDSYRRSDEKHVLQLYKGTDIAKKLRTIGFKVRIVKGYGKSQFPKNWVGLIAYKN